MKKKKKIKKRAQTKVSLPTEKTIIAQNIQDHIILVYGPPGIGKTTFVNGLSDSTLFISTDRGTRYMSALRKEVSNYKELDRTIKTLESEGADAYDIICLDHVDDICTMVEDYICDQLGIDALGDVGYAKGWKAYKKGIWSILQRLLRLNRGIALIAHESIRTIRTKVIESERMMPDMGKSAWKVLIPACDIVGYAGFKIVKQNGKGRQIRIIRTSPLESIYAKDRTTRVKSEEGYELLNGAKFAKTFEKQKGSIRHVKKKKKKRKEVRR